MSITMQQILADARRLSSRLRDHDEVTDQLISRSGEVLKEVEAMKQYQEDIENLNQVAHNRPRGHLILGIQQENRHIRTLQQENKELRAALEEHQTALELIMSKYREHVSKLASTPSTITTSFNANSWQLQEKIEKVHEMAGVVRTAVKLDEDRELELQELMAKLTYENKVLRELLEISTKNSNTPKVKKIVPNTDQSVQTELSSATHNLCGNNQVDLHVTLPMPVAPPRTGRAHQSMASCKADKLGGHQHEDCMRLDASPEPDSRFTPSPSMESSTSTSESDETSDDDSIKYDTIKLATRRRTVVQAETSKTEVAADNPPTSDAGSGESADGSKNSDADNVVAESKAEADSSTNVAAVKDDNGNCDVPEQEDPVKSSQAIAVEKAATNEAKPTTEISKMEEVAREGEAASDVGGCDPAQPDPTDGPAAGQTDSIAADDVNQVENKDAEKSVDPSGKAVSGTNSVDVESKSDVAAVKTDGSAELPTESSAEPASADESKDVAEITLVEASVMSKADSPALVNGTPDSGNTEDHDRQQPSSKSSRRSSERIVTEIVDEAVERSVEQGGNTSN